MEQYQVDAFASELFKGNPAAVCIMEQWLPVSQMQAIAQENNLSETAFAVPEKEGFGIRWFTPNTEVALCGHATLATAHVLFHHKNYPHDEIVFYSQKRGELRVNKIGGERLELNFPAEFTQEINAPADLAETLNHPAKASYKGRTDILLLFENETQIRDLTPDFSAMKNIEARGVIVTAPGDDVDFVSRFFAPQSGIDEDPVTGSAHTLLTPFWSERLGKSQMEAQQLSPRGGHLGLVLEDDRVKIAGKAITYCKSELYL